MITITNYTNPSVTVIDGTNDSVITTIPGLRPSDAAISPVTNKFYIANAPSAHSVTEIDGTNYSSKLISGVPGVFSILVNPITGTIYTLDGQQNAIVTVITPSRTNAIPLNTAVTPLAGNTARTSKPTFNLTATSTYSPTAPPPRNIYFQVDTTNGTWTATWNFSVSWSPR